MRPPSKNMPVIEARCVLNAGTGVLVPGIKKVVGGATFRPKRLTLLDPPTVMPS
jgi:hypothetical protein